MERIIDIAIEKVTGEWIKKHLNMIVKYDGRDVEFGDYILMYVTHNYINTLDKKFKEHVAKKRKGNLEYLEEEAIEELGYSEEDIKSPRFRELVYKVLKSKKTECMEIIENCDYYLAKPFSMTVRNNKKIEFSGMDLKRGVQAIIPKIRDYDPTFVDTIKERIEQFTDDNPVVKIPRKKIDNETDEEYERYLKEFYGGSSKK